VLAFAKIGQPLLEGQASTIILQFIIGATSGKFLPIRMPSLKYTLCLLEVGILLADEYAQGELTLFAEVLVVSLDTQSVRQPIHRIPWVQVVFLCISAVGTILVAVSL